jgi:hypothetical protein
MFGPMLMVLVTAVYAVPLIPVVRIAVVNHTGRAYEMAGKVREAHDVADLLRRAFPRGEVPASTVVYWGEGELATENDYSPLGSSSSLHIDFGHVWEGHFHLGE